MRMRDTMTRSQAMRVQAAIAWTAKRSRRAYDPIRHHTLGDDPPDIIPVASEFPARTLLEILGIDGALCIEYQRLQPLFVAVERFEAALDVSSKRGTPTTEETDPLLLETLQHIQKMVEDLKESKP